MRSNQYDGGVNHRQGLYDAIMVKDTHVDLLGGIAHSALAQLPSAKNLPNFCNFPTTTTCR